MPLLILIALVVLFPFLLPVFAVGILLGAVGLAGACIVVAAYEATLGQIISPMRPYEHVTHDHPAPLPSLAEILEANPEPDGKPRR